MEIAKALPGARATHVSDASQASSGGALVCVGCGALVGAISRDGGLCEPCQVRRGPGVGVEVAPEGFKAGRFCASCGATLHDPGVDQCECGRCLLVRVERLGLRQGRRPYAGFSGDPEGEAATYRRRRLIERGERLEDKGLCSHGFPPGRCRYPSDHVDSGDLACVEADMAPADCGTDWERALRILEVACSRATTATGHAVAVKRKLLARRLRSDLACVEENWQVEAERADLDPRTVAECKRQMDAVAVLMLQAIHEVLL